MTVPLKVLHTVKSGFCLSKSKHQVLLLLPFFTRSTVNEKVGLKSAGNLVFHVTDATLISSLHSFVSPAANPLLQNI